MTKMPVFLALFIALSFFGCSGRPVLTSEEEVPYNESEALIKQAGADLDTAKQAGAEVFAKDTLGKAGLALEDAKNALKIKEISKAKDNALKSSAESKKAITYPQTTENSIIETEKYVKAAKEAKIDEESPVAYKEAVDQIEAAKQAYNFYDFSGANLCVLKAANAIKKANEESIGVKNAVKVMEADMSIAKELKIDTISPDAYKNAVESYDFSKTSLLARNNSAAIESAQKVSAILNAEMKKTTILFVEQAKSDLNTAKEAGASEFSVEQLALAEDALVSANSAAEKNDYINAKNFAEKVSIISKEAETKAKAGKETKVVVTNVEVKPPKPAPVVVEEVKIQKPAPVKPTPVPVAKVVNPKPVVPAVKPIPAPVVKVTPSKPVPAPKVEATKPVSIPKKETTVTKAEKKAEVGESKNKAVLPVAEVKKAKTSGTFPVVPVAIAVFSVIVALFIIRQIRKKATQTVTQEV